MSPSYYECTSCRERFYFAFREAYYDLKSGTAEGSALDESLLPIPVRPAWCKDCSCLCIVEDIAPLRAFEAAYAVVRQGRPIEYPLVTEYLEPEAAEASLAGAYLRWRLWRKRAARALCCGAGGTCILRITRRLTATISPTGSAVTPGRGARPGYLAILRSTRVTTPAWKVTTVKVCGSRA